MRIAIIGAGHVGTTLGTGWTASGHEVSYGTRAPGSVRAAVDGAEVVVLATPWAGVDSALDEAGDFAG
ncbi:MAG TPA: NAD(P)-binding domain-containing protein, partial [Kofleriaceae bacterium]|nr:NAD(P)-binding domain-containing protein [Kofleriaceae bacterium]